MTNRLIDNKKALFGRLKREIKDSRVIDAMERVPRELFVAPEHRAMAYEDSPLSIGEGQTISQPFIVALMTAALQLSPSDRVLEVGTGSGYQAAVVSLLAREGAVVTVERIPALARGAAETLRRLGYHNVESLTAGPVLGCPDKAPYDAIVVTAAGPGLPKSLVDQLAVGGRMIIPVGSWNEQDLILAMKTGEGISIRSKGPCRFVPLWGREAWPAAQRQPGCSIY